MTDMLDGPNALEIYKKQRLFFLIAIVALFAYTVVSAIVVEGFFYKELTPVKEPPFKQAIFVYPGYITKGNKGKILWHSELPKFDEYRNDWENKKSVNVTNCINDPWPLSKGGKNLILEVQAAQ